MHRAPIYRIALVREGSLPYESLKCSADVANLVRPFFKETDRELFVVILLDAAHHVIGANVVSMGSLATSTAHPREVFAAAVADEEIRYGADGALFRRAVRHKAAGLVLAHNHPSNRVEPSPEDREITKRLRETGELLGIKVIDHVIVGAESHFSFVDSGYW